MKKITKYLNDLSISIEGTEYEFKVDLNKQDPIKRIKTVVAFSNDLGGKICIGVTNEGYAKGFSAEEADKRQIYFNMEQGARGLQQQTECAIYLY